MNIEGNRLKTEMSDIIGGVEPKCTCGCQYEEQGGSSTCENSAANFNGGLHSPIPGAFGCPDNELSSQQHWFCCD